MSQSPALARCARGSIARTSASPRSSQPASASAERIGAGSAKPRVDQQGLGCAADAGAAHLGVERDRPGHFGVRSAVDVGRAQPVEVRKHRHARLGLNARNQALAATRHDHVDRPLGLEHRPHRRAIGDWDELDRVRGGAARLEPARERGVDRVVAADRLGAAAENRGIACHDAQCAGVGGDVGAALVDDPDHADRDAHAREHHAVGPLDAVDHSADRIVEPRHRLDPRRRRFDPVGIEPEPVEQCAGEPVRLARRHVLGVGGADRGAVGADRLRGGLERACLGGAVHRRERRGRGAGTGAHRADQRGNIDRGHGASA